MSHKDQPRFKRKNKIPPLGGRVARSHCTRLWEVVDTVVAVFGKDHLSEPSYDLQRVYEYKDVST